MTLKSNTARRLWLVLLPTLLGACRAAPRNSSSRNETPPLMEVGESRDVELQYLRFNVTNFEKRLSKDALLALSQDIRERLWLLDLDLSNGPNTPHLLDNALSIIRNLDPTTLSQSEQNLQGLLRMTPDNANLTGTALEQLIDLAPLLGIAPQQVLADLLQVDVEDTFLSDNALASTILKQVISSHPNAQQRLGPKTQDNPDGIYPVTAGTLPVTLTDLASNFATLPVRFGPYSKDGLSHPGFISDAKASILTEDFALTVKANANALPFRGLDLSNASLATVVSFRSQIDQLFDFQDPNWMRVEGLVEGEPVIDSMTFQIFEYPEFVHGGLSPDPQGIGSSIAWQLPPFVLESVLINAAQTTFADLNVHDPPLTYSPPDEPDNPLVEASVVDGWTSIQVRAGLGSPPPPAYIWDLLLEIAQVRLHDGGLAEGDANVAFVLNHVPLGITTDAVINTVKSNLRDNPLLLLQLAENLLASYVGDPDFYYYRANDDSDKAGDWLYFIAPEDIPSTEDGQMVRPYRYDQYAQPGFYADPELRVLISDTTPVDGDTAHHKVNLAEHPEVYLADDNGSVFKLTAGPKPAKSKIALTVTRVR